MSCKIEELESIEELMKCYYCKAENISKYRCVNGKPVCQSCSLLIDKIRFRIDPPSSYKTFTSPTCQFLCKLTMTATSQFDFQMGLCSICNEKTILIKICVENHYFCETCIISHIQQFYQQSTQCIQKECFQIMNLQVIFQYLEQEQLIRWKPITEQVFCISPYCSADWSVWPTYISGNVVIIKLNQVKCKLCHKQFCRKCRTTHKGIICESSLFNNYLKRNSCFRCYSCNSLCEPAFCQNNYDVASFKEWNYNIYECFVCKKSFCFDCKENSKISLFSKYKCDNCIFTFKKWQEQKKKKPLTRQLIQGLFIFFIFLMFSIYSMIFLQIPQIFDVFFQKIDPICQTQNPLKITLLIINIPLLVAVMVVIYAVTLLPLAVYNCYTTFIRRGTVDIEV